MPHFLHFSLAIKSVFTVFVSQIYPSFAWKASIVLGTPKFSSHRVQLEARIEKLLQGCLLSPLVSGKASHRKLDETSFTYQRQSGQTVLAAPLQGKSMTFQVCPGARLKGTSAERGLDLTLQCGWITEILSLNFCRSNLKGFRLNHFQHNLVLQCTVMRKRRALQAGTETGSHRKFVNSGVRSEEAATAAVLALKGFSLLLTSFSKSLIVSVFIYFVLLYILNYFTTTNKKTHML